MQCLWAILLVFSLHHSLQACPIPHCLRCKDAQCFLCDLGYYGLNCTLQCPPHCVLPCVSGYCSKGCLKGWYGPKCTDTCRQGCTECEQNTGYCPNSGDPTPSECPVGCHCPLGFCSHCKTGYSGKRCDERDSQAASQTASTSYLQLQAGLIGIGLLLGATVMLSCVTFIFCRKFKKIRSTRRDDRSRRRRSSSRHQRSSSTSVELQDVPEEPVNALPVQLPPYHVSYAPPSYESLFEIPLDKPPPYNETTEHL